MAEVIIPTGFGSAAIRFLDSSSGKISSVTWGYKMDPGGTAADNASSIATAVGGTASMMAPPQYAAATYLESVYVLEHVSGGFRSAEVTIHTVGTRSGSAVAPPQVAVGIQKKCAFVGKRQRGRLFLPANFLLANDYVERGSPTALRVSQLETAATVMLANLFTATLPMYLLHTHPDDAPTIVQDLKCAPVLRTQRRRLPRT